MRRGRARSRIMTSRASLVGWLLCTAAAWWWAAGYGGQAAWFSAVVMSGLLLCVLVVGAGVMVRPEVTRDLSREQVHAGERVRVKLEVRSRRRWLPLTWIYLRDEWLDVEGKIAFVHETMMIPAMLKGNSFVHEYELPLRQRGIYISGAVTIEAAQPLGLAGRRWRLDAAENKRRLTVYPQPLRGLADAMPRLGSDSGAAAGAAMAVVAASPLVSTVREYAHGDPLQRIHWKSSARTGGLKTKELDALEERRVVVVLDDAGYGGPGMRARFETAASAACAVVMAAKRGGLAAMVRCGEAVSDAAGAPAAAERRALELLAAVRPRGGGDGSRGAALREHGRRQAGLAGSTALTGVAGLVGLGLAGVPLVVITPQLDSRLLEQIGELCARRSSVTLLYIKDGDGSDDSAGSAAESRLLRELEVMGCKTWVIEAADDGERLDEPSAALAGDKPLVQGGALRHG